MHIKEILRNVIAIHHRTRACGNTLLATGLAKGNNILILAANNRQSRSIQDELPREDRHKILSATSPSDTLAPVGRRRPLITEHHTVNFLAEASLDNIERLELRVHQREIAIFHLEKDIKVKKWAITDYNNRLNRANKEIESLKQQLANSAPA